MTNTLIDGDRLKAARALLRWRQIDLAEASGVSERGVQQIEEGRRKGRPETHAKLRAALEAAGIAFTRDGGVRRAPRKGHSGPDDGNGERPAA